MSRWLVIAVLVSGSAHAGKSRFHFQLPPGWTNLSADAPPSELAKAPPALLEQVRSGHFAFFAADLSSAADGFMENVNVIVEPGSTEVTPQFLHQVAESIAEEAKKNGTNYRVVETGLSKVGGVTVGRYLGELKLGETTVKQIGYLLPGHDEHAVVTYSTTPAELAHYQPIFDAAAQSTVGVEEPPLVHWQTIVATVAALGLLVGYSVWAKKRQQAG